MPGKDKPTTLYSALQPFLILKALAGFAVFKNVQGRAWPTLTWFFCIARMALLSWLLWYKETFLSDIDITNPTLGNLWIYRCVLYSNFITMTYGVIVFLLNYRKIDEWIEQIRLADETLELFGVSPQYAEEQRIHRNSLLVWCLLALINIISCFLFTHYIYGHFMPIFVEAIIYEFPMEINSVITFSFSRWVWAIGNRFKKLNALLRSASHDPIMADSIHDSLNLRNNLTRRKQKRIFVMTSYHIKNKNNIELLLKTTRQLHLKLCSVARDINDVYSKPLTFQLGTTFFIVTGLLYLMYQVFTNSGELFDFRGKLHHYAAFGAWVISTAIRLLSAIRICVIVMTEANKSSQVAHEIETCRTDNKYANDIHQFSLQIMQHPLTFTANGFVSLDFVYIRGFTASVTTYLMILIQNQPMINVEAPSYNNNTS